MIIKLVMGYFELKHYRVILNDDPGLTLTYFTPMLNLAKLDFVPRYQVSVYKTIGPLVLLCHSLGLPFYIFISQFVSTEMVNLYSCKT